MAPARGPGVTRRQHLARPGSQDLAEGQEAQPRGLALAQTCWASVSPSVTGVYGFSPPRDESGEGCSRGHGVTALASAPSGAAAHGRPVLPTAAPPLPGV